MSQARARSLQTAKSLIYLKVRSGTNTSGSYWSDRSFKALSFAKKCSPLESAAIDECHNPSGFYRETFMGFQRNFGGASVNISRNRQCSGRRYLILNRSYSGMVNSHEKIDEAGKGRKLLEKLDSLCKDQKLKEAVEILGLLEQHNVSVDIPRYLFLMNECGESQAPEEAKHVHNHLTRSLPHLDIHIHNKILEMYLKCGAMENACEVFDKLPQRNLTSWDTMITGFAENGHGEEALSLFTEFRKLGLKPDNQMFHGVFFACKVVADMQEGMLHFKSMTENYNLVPTMEDYVSVVDMLAGAARLEEALEFTENMPIEPSVEIWEIMMYQSRVHGDFEIHNRCAEVVKLLEPSRLDKHVKHGFRPTKHSKRVDPEQTCHPDHEMLYGKLRCLVRLMKKVGYVPDTSSVLYDVEEENKEQLLLTHSVKLALMAGLLSTPPCTPVQIINDSRICRDCHNFLKIVSKVVGRQIIARVEGRFHHFENGVCSCGDFW